MRLMIKKKYFDLIKSGDKFEDFRDAHITFVCEETGEILRKDVARCYVEPRPGEFLGDVLGDDFMIVFEFER